MRGVRPSGSQEFWSLLGEAARMKRVRWIFPLRTASNKWWLSEKLGDFFVLTTSVGDAIASCWLSVVLLQRLSSHPRMVLSSDERFPTIHFFALLVVDRLFSRPTLLVWKESQIQVRLLPAPMSQRKRDAWVELSRSVCRVSCLSMSLMKNRRVESVTGLSNVAGSYSLCFSQKLEDRKLFSRIQWTWKSHNLLLKNMKTLLCLEEEVRVAVRAWLAEHQGKVCELHLACTWFVSWNR